MASDQKYFKDRTTHETAAMKKKQTKLITEKKSNRNKINNNANSEINWGVCSLGLDKVQIPNFSNHIHTSQQPHMYYNT